jgi:hypothetical protein
MDPAAGSAASAPATSAEPRRTARWVVAALLATTLAMSTAAALTGAWARALVYDTEHYVQTVAPLIDEPAVQEALSSQITDQVVGAVDATLEELPTTIRQLLAGPAARLGDLVADTVTTAVGSDEFAQAWAAANRSAHEQIAGSLTGQNDAVTVEDGTVAIEAEVFVQAGKDGLAEIGLEPVADLLPAADGSFVVLQSQALPVVQTAVRTLDGVGRWMWLVSVLLAVAIVAVAPRRRYGGLVATAGVALGALLVMVGMALLRQGYLASTGVLSTEAKSVIFARLAADLRSSSLLALTAAVAIGLAVWLAGLVLDRARRPEPVREDAPHGRDGPTRPNEGPAAAGPRVRQ